MPVPRAVSGAGVFCRAVRGGGALERGALAGCAAGAGLGLAAAVASGLSRATRVRSFDAGNIRAGAGVDTFAGACGGDGARTSAAGEASAGGACA